MTDYLEWLKTTHNNSTDLAALKCFELHVHKPKSKLPDDTSIIKKLLEDGLTLKEIGEQFDNATRQTVSFYLKRNGIVLDKNRILKNKKIKEIFVKLVDGCNLCESEPHAKGLCKKCYNLNRYRMNINK